MRSGTCTSPAVHGSARTVNIAFRGLWWAPKYWMVTVESTEPYPGYHADVKKAMEQGLVCPHLYHVLEFCPDCDEPEPQSA